MTNVQSRKEITAASVPWRVRLMQYSILVLAGPDSAWDTLNSSWN